MKTRSTYSSILLFELIPGDQCVIVYFNDKKEVKHLESIVEKIIPQGDAGIMLLKDGIEIPIDKIISVNGNISPNYTEDYEGCSCK